MSSHFAALQAAAIDGRTHSIYYRQHQLEALHQALLDHSSEIKNAIAADTEHTPAEIAIEIHLALSALKTSYETLQPAKALADEYLIASGKDAPTNRIPYGIAYIEPCTHTMLYSIVAPLSAAIAAGNCAIVLVSRLLQKENLPNPSTSLTTPRQLENNLRTLTSVLRSLFQSSLHPDTFAIASSPIQDTALLNSALVIDQNSSDRWPRANVLASPSRSSVFAIVDRTADVRLAARELVAARFAFGGSSAYAPDLVLVNEFVKQEFLQAAIEESRRLGDGRLQSEKAKGSSKVSESIEKFKKGDSKVEVVMEEAGGVVLELPARRAEMLEVKTDAPIMAVHAVKSLDDAIDFIESAEGGPALAAYHFGNPQVGKYLAQFVDARASFVNHVPRDLLVGPAHPATQVFDVSATHTVDMFSLPRPAFITPSTASSEIAAAMSSAHGSRKLLESALSPLKAMKRKPGGGVGEFLLAKLPFRCMWHADNLCARFLRARLASQCRVDPYGHHQCDGGWHCLACEEWKDSVFGAVQGLDWWFRGIPGEGVAALLGLHM
jgi:hypothetical protein